MEAKVLEDSEGEPEKIPWGWERIGAKFPFWAEGIHGLQERPMLVLNSKLHQSKAVKLQRSQRISFSTSQRTYWHHTGSNASKATNSKAKLG